MGKEYKNLINGLWTGSSNGKTFEQLNPAELEEVTGVWPASTREDTKTAIEAASKAYKSWSKISVYRRIEYFKKVLEGMKRRKQEFAQILTKENGKTLKESEAEINSAIKEMEFQIHEGPRLEGQTLPTSMDGVFAYSVRQPLGVVSIISPWNFPFNVPSRKMTPALMAGNTCVFKPSSLTPGTGQKFVELFVEADFPAGVINFITGDGLTVGKEMITNPLIKAISFTGSTGIGKKINQTASDIMAKTQLEMGGKNPIVVLEDADLDSAVGSAAQAAYACAGQWCTSTSRAIVIRKNKNEFIERLIERAQKIIVGNGMDNKTTMGPVCGKAQMESIMNYIDIGKKEGASLVLGGNRITTDGLDKGCFIEPTIFSGVKTDMRIAREEIFGPVLSIIEVSDFKEAVEVANNVEFGLSSSIYTNNLQKAFTFLEKTETGLTHINLMTALKEPQFSFGGIKGSGFGLPEAGKSGIEFFTEHKVAYVKYR